MPLLESPSDAVRGLAKYSSAFAAGASTLNTTMVSGRPNHAPQVVDFFNASSSASQNAVWKDVNGVSHTTPIAPLGRYTPPIPVSEITGGGSTGANVSADLYWFPARGHTIN